MRPPRGKKEAERARKSGAILTALSLLARIEVDPGLDAGQILYTPMEHESAVRKLREHIHARQKNGQDYDSAKIDDWLDQVVADPSHFHSFLSKFLSKLSRTASRFNAHVRKTIEEKGFCDPITDRVEFRKNAIVLHLEDASGKTASFEIYSGTLQ